MNLASSAAVPPLNGEAPTTEPHRSLRAQAEALLVPLIAGREREILIADTARTSNVGDHAITLGLLSLLRWRFPHARLTLADSHDPRSTWEPLVRSASLVILQGGGNFGDLWPPQHAFRLAILERFPDVPKLQMPQSICITTAPTLARTARALAAQRDHTLVLRDAVSHDFARRHFEGPTLLCPDAAYLLPRLERPPAAAGPWDVVALLRSDRERKAPHAEILKTLVQHGHRVSRCDWFDAPPTLAASMEWRLRRVRSLAPHLTSRVAWPLRVHHARARLAAGLAMLGRGGLLVADRLHAHILASLVGMPSYTFDSHDGKIAAFHHTWLANAPDQRLVGSVAELDRLLAARGASRA